MTISALPASGAPIATPSATTATATTATITRSTNWGLATLAVSLAGDAGVIATLSGATAQVDSTAQLYNALANAGQSAAAAPSTAAASGDDSSTGASGTDAGAGSASGSTSADTGTGTANAIDPNAAWASLVKSNPGLAPLAAQLSEQQGLIDTLA